MGAGPTFSLADDMNVMQIIARAKEGYLLTDDDRQELRRARAEILLLQEQEAAAEKLAKEQARRAASDRVQLRLEDEKKKAAEAER